MTRRTILKLFIVFAVLGLLDAGYLAEAAMTDTPLVCNIDGLTGCNVVAQSPYAHVLGIPLGLYGVAFYLLLLILGFWLLFRPTRGIDRVLVLLSGIGLLASCYFLYIQIALIKALCIYCIGSAVIALILAGLALWYLRTVEPPLPPAA